MVSDTGEVKITDFGVSYSTGQGQITQDGMVVGTAQYISPEQAQGQQATPQSDIYSLGVVAYEGLAGHRPFTGTTPVDIAAAHVNNPVPPLPDSVDVQLREFVMPRTRWIARKTRWWCPVRWHASNAVCWISRPKWPTPPWPRPAIDCRAE